LFNQKAYFQQVKKKRNYKQSLRGTHKDIHHSQKNKHNNNTITGI